MGRSRQAGRATRKRRRKEDSLTQSVALCDQPQYVRLMKFLHGRGFTSRMLQPAHFTDTGRGLQALRTVKPGELLVSLPESCLLTTSTVLDSYLGHYIKSWKPRLSPLVALCILLVCERHRGEASDWFPYIDVLPSTYTCPVYFTDETIAVLPASVQLRALKQREAVQELHSANQDFFRSLQPILTKPVEEVLTYEALRWAWCSVNTRSVFMSHAANNFLCGQDVYALAPFLDLLNHQPAVQVKASFNNVTRCYEITSVAGVKRYHQAFINYGSHDNQRLLLEYGFIAPCNPHSVVYVDSALLTDVLRGDRSLEQKMKFLRENHFLHHHWKAVLLGQAVCKESEQWSLRTASTVCQRLLKETRASLEKITHLLQRCDRSIKEQLIVAQSLRQEEKCILGSCLMELESMQVTS